MSPGAPVGVQARALGGHRHRGLSSASLGSTSASGSAPRGRRAAVRALGVRRVARDRQVVKRRRALGHGRHESAHRPAARRSAPLRVASAWPTPSAISSFERDALDRRRPRCRARSSPTASRPRASTRRVAGLTDVACRGIAVIRSFAVPRSSSGSCSEPLRAGVIMPRGHLVDGLGRRRRLARGAPLPFGRPRRLRQRLLRRFACTIHRVVAGRDAGVRHASLFRRRRDPTARSRCRGVVELEREVVPSTRVIFD